MLNGGLKMKTLILYFDNYFYVNFKRSIFV